MAAGEEQAAFPATAPKPFVFVLMPFDKGFRDVYKLGIKPACEKAGAYAERLDEQIFGESMLERIYNQIAKADIIVADMTGRNPNVFYETGYAHALNKHVILLTKTVDDIPFDLKHYAHIVYEDSITDLIPELERHVRWAIQNLGAAPVRDDTPVKLYTNGLLLEHGASVPCPSKQPTKYLAVPIDMLNSPEHSVEAVSFQLAFHTSETIVSMDAGSRGSDRSRLSVNGVVLPTGGHQFIIEKDFSLLPGGSRNLRLHFGREAKLQFGQFESVQARILTTRGVSRRDFRLHAARKEEPVG